MKKKSLYDEINEEFSRLIDEDAILMGAISSPDSGMVSNNSETISDNSILTSHGKIDDHSITFSDTLGDYKPGDGVMSAKNNYTGNGLSAMAIQKRVKESDETLDEINQEISKLEKDEIISEDKTSLIKNRLVLPDISDDSEKEAFKATLIDFFKKHPNYENKIDWNKAKTLTKADFQKVLDLKGTSKKAQKKEIQSNIRNIFKTVGERKFEYIGENDNWFFVAPLTWEAAKYCDSSENQGAGAKWCIGIDYTNKYWQIYYEDKHSIFILAFNKKYKELSKQELETQLKYMVQREFSSDFFTESKITTLWDQKDVSYKVAEKLDISGFKILEDGFDKLAKTRREEKEKQMRMAKKYANEVNTYLSSLSVINADSIPKNLKKAIKEINIPSNIKSIEEDSFKKLRNLNFVQFSDGIQIIGKNAFAECFQLKSINLPDSLIELGEFAFSVCSELSTNLVIPKGITEIKTCTFMDCHNIKSLTFKGNNLKSIGWNSFAGLYEITSLELPDSLKRIERGGFSYCKSLKSVHIGSKVNYIGPSAFNRFGDYGSYGMPNLTITFAKGFDKSILKKESFDSKTTFVFEE